MPALLIFSDHWPPHLDKGCLFRQLRAQDDESTTEFLQESTNAIRREIHLLPSKLQSIFPKFECFTELVESKLFENGALAGALNNALLSILQLGAWLCYITKHRSAQNLFYYQNVKAVGAGVGLFASNAISTSADMQECQQNGAEAVRLAFKTGLQVHYISGKLVPAVRGAPRACWTRSVDSSHAEELRAEIARISKESKTSLASRIFVSADKGDTLEVSGPPLSLHAAFVESELLRESFIQTCEHVTDGLYHAPHLYYETDVQDILDGVPISASPSSILSRNRTEETCVNACNGDLDSSARRLVEQLLMRSFRIDEVKKAVTVWLASVRDDSSDLMILDLFSGPVEKNIVRSLHCDWRGFRISHESLLDSLQETSDSLEITSGRQPCGSLSEAPPSSATNGAGLAPTKSRRAHPIIMSAPSEVELKGQAKHLLSMLKTNAELSIENLSYSLCTKPTKGSWRASCIVHSGTEAAAFLDRILDGKVSTSEMTCVDAAKPPVILEFAEDTIGTQRSFAMDLANEFAFFKSQLRQFNSVVRAIGYQSILHLVHCEKMCAEKKDFRKATEISRRLADVIVMCSLARFFVLFGVMPVAVHGNGIGRLSSYFISNVMAASDVLFATAELVKSTEDKPGVVADTEAPPQVGEVTINHWGTALSLGDKRQGKNGQKGTKKITTESLGSLFRSLETHHGVATAVHEANATFGEPCVWLQISPGGTLVKHLAHRQNEAFETTNPMPESEGIGILAATLIQLFLRGVDVDWTEYFRPRFGALQLLET